MLCFFRTLIFSGILETCRLTHGCRRCNATIRVCDVLQMRCTNTFGMCPKFADSLVAFSAICPPSLSPPPPGGAGGGGGRWVIVRKQPDRIAIAHPTAIAYSSSSSSTITLRRLLRWAPEMAGRSESATIASSPLNSSAIGSEALAPVAAIGAAM